MIELQQYMLDKISDFKAKVCNPEACLNNMANCDKEFNLLYSFCLTHRQFHIHYSRRTLSFLFSVHPKNSHLSAWLLKHGCINIL